MQKHNKRAIFIFFSRYRAFKVFVNKLNLMSRKSFKVSDVNGRGNTWSRPWELSWILKGCHAFL